MVETTISPGKKRFLLGVVITLVVVAVTTAIVVTIVFNTDDVDDEEVDKKQPPPTTPAPTRPAPTRPAHLHLVSAQAGDIVGRHVNATLLNGESKQVYEFINIPYAHPPQRWRRPLPCTKASPCWTGEYPANITSDIQCPQMLNVAGNLTPLGREDCLYLTLRTPSLSGKRPVLFWIHGGSLLQNWNTRIGYSIDGEMALDMDVVGVSINYRLSSLGFLSMEELWHEEDPASYGNYGFFDQLLALQWVKENIANFGGDPDSITLMGESSGATSVLALLSAPMANGLFHRAILMTPLPRWENDYKTAAIRNARGFFPTLAHLEKCNVSSFENRQTCLKNAKIHNLTTATIFQLAPNVRVAGAFPKPGEEGMLGLSITDSVLVKKDPTNLACANMATASKIPILLGNMAQETNAYTANRYNEDEWSKMHNHVVSQLSLFNITDIQHIFNVLYPNMTSTNETIPPQRIADQMTSDIRVTCPTNTAASKMAESTQHTIYRYYMSHRPSSPVNGWTEAHHSWCSEALFNFLYSKFYFNFTATQHDFEFRDKLREVFKNFTHSAEVSAGWKPYPENTYIISNEATKLEIVDGEIQREQCNYWDHLGFQRYAWHN